MSKLKRIERETVITFNENEDLAVVTTADRTVIRKIKKLMEENDSISASQVSKEVWQFGMPKKFLKFRLPRKMTDEQRKAASERAKERFGKK